MKQKSQITDRKVVALRGALEFIIYLSPTSVKRWIHFLSYKNYLFIIQYMPHSFLASRNKTGKKNKQCFLPYNCNRNRRNKPNTYVHTHSHAHAHTLTQYLGGTDPKIHGLSLQQPATILLKTVFVEGAIQQKHKTMPGRQNTRVVFEISLIKSYFYFMYSKNL